MLNVFIAIAVLLALAYFIGAIKFYFSDETEDWKEEIEKEYGMKFWTTRGAIKFAERKYLDDLSKELEEEYGIKKYFRTYFGACIWCFFHRRLFK